MKYQLRSLVYVGLSLAIACNPDAKPITGPELGVTADLRAQDRASITVLGRNLYIGANVDAVIAALATLDPSDDIPTLLNAVAVLGETDWPARARALADEIARSRPHVIGLQEVTQLDIDLSPLGIPVVIHQDFLPTLLAELTTRGLDYTLAAENTNTQATPFPGIGLTDHDAILVDASRVTAVNPVAQNFTLNIGVVAPGVEIKRGWVGVDAIIDGVPYTIVNTHLESGSAPGLDQLRAGQVLELVTSLGSSDAVMLGDFNDVPGSLMYQVVAGAGFGDAWSAIHPHENGLTCCHLANLANETATFDQRIDYVFTRGIGRLSDGRDFIARIGANRQDRIQGPAHSIWPSDHAGLVAALLVPPSLVESK